MEKRKTPLSIRIIYWLTEVAFGLTILSGLAVIIFNVLLFTSFFGNDLQLHVEFPVKFNVLDQGVLDYNGLEMGVELVDATSRIHFIDTPMPVARIFGSAILLAFGFILYIMYMFRKFIVNVKNNRVFEPGNIEYLRNISYALLGLWLYAVVYSRILHGFFLHSITFTHVEIVDDYRNFAGMLMLALFIWVLSHVFLTGTKLKEDQDLTI